MPSVDNNMLLPEPNYAPESVREVEIDLSPLDVDRKLLNQQLLEDFKLRMEAKKVGEQSEVA